MTDIIMSSTTSIHDIPDFILVQILEKLETLEQHEAGMVNKKWFDCIYKNPRNVGVLSIVFGNCYLDDLEPPLCYFIDSKIPYKRLVIGHNVLVGSVEKSFAKFGETLDELVIKQSITPKKKHEKKSVTAGRVADILEHMKHLTVLEINWSLQNEFMNRNTLFQRENGEKVMQALKNVKDFRLIARDVIERQFFSFIQAFKNLESLYVNIQYSSYFFNEQNENIVNWYSFLAGVKHHASTLRHLFVDLHINQQAFPVNKEEFLERIRMIRQLKLESFSLDLSLEFDPTFLRKIFMIHSDTLTTLGLPPKFNSVGPPMQIGPGNLTTLIRILPKLQNINVEISHGLFKNLKMFESLSDLRTLHLNVNRFQPNHHIFHRETKVPVYEQPPILPKLKELKINGSVTNGGYRPACIKCCLYIHIFSPNITHLELSTHDSVTNQCLLLIFYHLTNLEVLGLTCSREVTDDAFIGIYGQNHSERYSIANLKRLHTLLIYPLEHISDYTFVYGISQLSNLKRFAINGLSHITEIGIGALINGCSKLEVLYLEDCVEFDKFFIKFIINRLIHLKYLRIGGLPHISEEITNIEGIEYSPDGLDNRTVEWKAHNAYKVKKFPLPMNLVDLESL